MMTDLLLLGTATLAAFAIGSLGLAAADMLSARVPPRSSATPPPATGRWLPWMRAIWMPSQVRRRWADPALTSRLQMGGVPWVAEDFASLRWMLLGIGAVLAALTIAVRADLVGWFLGAVLVAAAWMGPTTWISLRLERREREIDRSLPDFLDRLSLALEAGLGFEVALRRSAERFPGRLGDELRRLVRQLDRGHPRQQVLEELAARNPSDDLRAFTAAVRQADRLGTSLAKALRVQSGLLRNRRRRRAQEASRRLPVLIVFPLVFFFLPALLIIYLAPPLLHLFLGQ